MEEKKAILVRLPLKLHTDLQAEADRDPANPGNLNALIRRALAEWVAKKKSLNKGS